MMIVIAQHHCAMMIVIAQHHCVMMIVFGDKHSSNIEYGLTMILHVILN